MDSERIAECCVLTDSGFCVPALLKRVSMTVDSAEALEGLVPFSVQDLNSL